MLLIFRLAESRLISTGFVDHVADLPVGREQADLHRLRVVLALVLLIFFRLISQEVVLDHRHNHFLQADAAVHEVQSGSGHLDANILSRRKTAVLCVALKELDLLQVIRIGILHHDGKAPAVFHDPVNKPGLVHLVILVEGTVGIRIFAPPHSLAMIRTIFLISSIAVSQALKMELSR